ncbi:hypothetical protein KY284_010214 [Solanum tuberosum]|nr:hypothetical protein KY284_010214 [Solanum tuberosum]
MILLDTLLKLTGLQLIQSGRRGDFGNQDKIRMSNVLDRRSNEFVNQLSAAVSLILKNFEE